MPVGDVMVQLAKVLAERDALKERVAELEGRASAAEREGSTEP